VCRAHAGQLRDDSRRPEEAGVYEAPAVLRLLWADPQYMPEHLALWSLEHFGPRACSALERLGRSYPKAGPGELQAAVIERQGAYLDDRGRSSGVRSSS
jgi:hypothetical protein